MQHGWGSQGYVYLQDEYLGKRASGPIGLSLLAHYESAVVTDSGDGLGRGVYTQRWNISRAQVPAQNFDANLVHACGISVLSRLRSLPGILKCKPAGAWLHISHGLSVIT
jgi:hypothetical protein